MVMTKLSTDTQRVHQRKETMGTKRSSTAMHTAYQTKEVMRMTRLSTVIDMVYQMRVLKGVRRCRRRLKKERGASILLDCLWEVKVKDFAQFDTAFFHFLTDWSNWEEASELWGCNIP